MYFSKTNIGDKFKITFNWDETVEYVRVGSNSVGPTFKRIEDGKVTGRATALHEDYITNIEPVK